MEETANMAHNLNGNPPKSERRPVADLQHYNVIKKTTTDPPQ